MGISARLLYGLLLLVLGAAMPARAQELEVLAARYLDAETYCEAGTYGVRMSPKEAFSQERFSGCAHRDGRFRFLEHPGPLQVVTWSNGETLYRYWQSNGQYREYPLAQSGKLYFFGYRRAGAAFLQSRLFTRGAYENPSLGGYARSGALSTPEHMVFERRDERWGNTERLWVRNADKAIFRYEQARNGEVLRFVELSAQEAGRPLSDAELSHRVSSLTHVSLQNNPAAFFAGLVLAVVLAAGAFWAWVFARTPDVDEVLRKRRLLWKVQLWGLGAAGGLTGVLALLSVAIPGGGHPPFIVVVMVMALWGAVVFGLAALFTSMSYPVQRLLALRLRRSRG